MISFLLDSDWAIDTIAGRTRTITLLQRINPFDIGISFVSIGEIYDGAFDSVNPQQRLANFRAIIGAFEVLLLDDAIMERFAELRSALRRRGRAIPNFDLLIAATALHHDLTLLTHNRRHFERVPDLRLYQPDGG